jgi:NDP-sugar pyrophosphorylase family protein
MKRKISITIDDKTLDDIDGIVDRIYIRNRSQAIEHLVRTSLGENKVAVILAGGKESSFSLQGGEYRFTAKVGKFRVVERAVRKLRSHGFKSVYIIARHNLLTKFFEILKEGSDYGVNITYIEEKSSTGSAHSLRLAKGSISTTFLVVYADIIFDNVNIEELWNTHVKQNAITTIMLTTSNKPSEKGTVKVEGNRVLEFAQKPKRSDIYLVFSPIFVAEPELLNYTGASLESDVFPALAGKGLLNGHLSSEKERHIHTKKDI